MVKNFFLKKAASPSTRVLLINMGGHGDVLLNTAILPAIKAKWPNAHITFCTNKKEVLKHNPYIDYLTDKIKHEYDQVINFTNAVARDPYGLILDVFISMADVDPLLCTPYLHCLPHRYKLPNSYAVLHVKKPTKDWVGRYWTVANFQEIVRRLTEKRVNVVQVGQKRDYPLKGVIDLRGKLTIGQFGTVVKNSNLFIGIDSFPMHMAQIFSIPGVAFFGSVLPRTRIFSPSMVGIHAKHLGCIGCLHRNMTPMYTVIPVCARGDEACQTEVSVDQFWALVEEKLLAIH